MSQGHIHLYQSTTSTATQSNGGDQTLGRAMNEGIPSEAWSSSLGISSGLSAAGQGDAGVPHVYSYIPPNPAAPSDLASSPWVSTGGTGVNSMDADFYGFGTGIYSVMTDTTWSPSSRQPSPSRRLIANWAVRMHICHL